MTSTHRARNTLEITAHKVVDLGKLANPEERHATLDNGFDALVPASTKLGDYVLDGTAVVDGSVFEAAYELIAPDLFSA